MRILVVFFIFLSWGLLAKEKSLHEFPSWYPKESCSQTSAQREECLKDWTVLIYMAADNDLSPYALWDLYEMERMIKGEKNLGATTDKVDVVVELDTLRRTGIRRYHVFQNEKEYDERLGLEDFDHADESLIESPLLVTMPEEGKSAKERFQSFLQWGLKKFPAKKTMVVIWGHGEGFLGKEFTSSEKAKDYDVRETQSLFFEEAEFELVPFSELPDAKVFPLKKPFGGVAFDHSDKTFLDLQTLGEILREEKAQTFEGKKNIDLFAFDACLMQSLEVMTELQSSTDFIVGSNQIQNYLGLPYRRLLDRLNEEVDSHELARALPVLAKSSFENEGYQGMIDDQGFKTFTLSSFASQQLTQSLLLHLHKVSVQLGYYLNEKTYRKNELLFLLEKAPRFLGETMDLGMFYGLLEKLLYEEAQRDLGTPTSRVLQRTLSEAHFRLREGVIEGTFGPLYYDTTHSLENGYLLGFFRGISVWLPKNSRLYQAREKEMHKSFLFEQLTSWKDFLTQLYKEKDIDLGLGAL